MKTFQKMMLDRLFLTQMSCALTPKLLSLSLQRKNGANEAQGVEIWALYTRMEVNGRPKFTQILI